MSIATETASEAPVNEHGGKSLEMLASEIAEAIAIGDRRTHSVAALLVAFANEIKREAIEP
jgi:hypothetical protein